MSAIERVDSSEKLKMNAGEAFYESHESALPDASSPTQDSLEDFSTNSEHGPNFIDDADKAFVVLFNVFRYLPRKELFSAARVCKVWNLVGSDRVFWKKISLNNCVVQDFNVMAQTLKKYETEILYLRGIRFFETVRSDTEWSDIVRNIKIVLDMPSKWFSLCKALTEVTTLTEVIFGECPKEAVTLFAKGAPQLKSLSAYHLDKDHELFFNDENLDITFLRSMNNLQTLILKNYKQKKLNFDASSSDSTDQIKLTLKELAITRAINLSCLEHILPSTLISLELGEFHTLTSDFYDIVLPKFVNLNRLRLEYGIVPDLTNSLVEKVSQLPNLSELELINFRIGNGFSTAIAKCINLKSLLIIPIYNTIPQSMHQMINNLILSGVSKLKNSLQLFVWVVTDQTIPINYVQRLRINQRMPNVRIIGDGDSIPFILSNDVYFISLDNIQSFLLPDLKCKVFKTSFPSTWKISIHNIKI